MEQLVVCEVCRRHVKISEARCPFCTSTSSRSLALLGAAVVGMGLSFSCGGETTSNDGGSDAASADADGGPVAAYGPPPWDAAPPPDAAADADGGAVVAYGPPPPQDGGQD